MSLTILGLGPGAWEHLTLEAQAVLMQAQELYLRTIRHPTAERLPKHLKVFSFDHLYEAGPTFEAVYQAIIQEVLRLASRPGGVIYAVPGHPLVGEATVQALLPQARERGIPVRLISGLSFLDTALAALELDPLAEGVQVVDALEPKIDPTMPAIVAQVYDQRTASAVKLALLEMYPPEHRVTLVVAAGIPEQEKVVNLPLHELDRRPSFDHLTCLYLPPIKVEDNLGSFAALQHIMARLRAPDGCPWDREQTHASIKRHLIEECYEVVEALDEKDPDKLCEELGDLLMQIVLHAQIAAEAGEFEMRDVLRGISAKLIRRHPHVFGDVTVSSAQEVAQNWEAIKQTEREEGVSLLASVPKEMPALAYSQAIQSRAAKVGFEWPDFQGVLDKLREELDELKKAHTEEERLHEFGDILASLVNVARWLKIDAEESLRLANQRFYRRFSHMEKLAQERGTPLNSLTLDELDALWNDAKRREKAG